jgi:outer membrane receptor protein involved in Fe transport
MTRIHRHTSRLVLCGYLLGAGLSRSADVPSTNAPTVLPEVTVVGHTRPGSLTSPTLDQADGQKEQVPGGFTTRGTGEMDRGRASNFQDLLQGVPGVTLQTENGMEVSKVSIRGSGILSEDEPLGVAFLLDGFSFNQGDGEVLRQSYTLNDLHFDDDPVYGNNRIGGIPIHLYDASLMYEHPSGFYAGPNLQWNITRYPVDHANTLYADAYALIGFRVGFESRKGFSAFFEAKNLGDKRYAASVDPIPDARTADGPIEIFHPGDGRSFYGGVSWKW